MKPFKKIAQHFKVDVGCVQHWVRCGFSRDWSIEEMEKWRLEHLESRVETEKTKKWKAALAKLPPEKAIVEATGSEIPADAAFESYNDARIAKIKREVERLDLKIKRERGELVLASEIREMAVRVISVWCSELDALVGDLPGQLSGLSEREIQPKLRNRIELLKVNCKKSFSAL